MLVEGDIAWPIAMQAIKDNPVLEDNLIGWDQNIFVLSIYQTLAEKLKEVQPCPFSQFRLNTKEGTIIKYALGVSHLRSSRICNVYMEAQRFETLINLATRGRKANKFGLFVTGFPFIAARSAEALAVMEVAKKVPSADLSDPILSKLQMFTVEPEYVKWAKLQYVSGPLRIAIAMANELPRGTSVFVDRSEYTAILDHYMVKDTHKREFPSHVSAANSPSVTEAGKPEPEMDSVEGFTRFYAEKANPLPAPKYTDMEFPFVVNAQGKGEAPRANIKPPADTGLTNQYRSKSLRSRMEGPALYALLSLFVAALFSQIPGIANPLYTKTFWVILAAMALIGWCLSALIDDDDLVDDKEDDGRSF